VWKYILNDEQPEHEQSDQDGVLYKYGRWKLDSKHFFMQQYAKLYSAQFHKKTGLLVVGFDNGYAYNLYWVAARLTRVIQSIWPVRNARIPQHSTPEHLAAQDQHGDDQQHGRVARIRSVAVRSSVGVGVAVRAMYVYTIDIDCCVVTDFGVSDILKQQGHYFDMNTLAYSPEGQYIATGGQDAKLKVWNASTGFCFVTFKGNVDRAII
jgi:periodic tryptophan protein 2